MSSPTVRSLKYMRDHGFTCGIVERYNSFTHTRSDLYGFLDILCIHPAGTGVVGVQTTSTSNINARIKKILGIPEARIFLEAENGLFVHGWSKKGARNKRKLWKLKEAEITLKDFI